MSSLDAAIVALYFATVLGAGFWYARRAARDLDSYFLGGKRIHWLALSMSGSVSNFDITGTMWIVSLIFVLGMKSMWVHWMWGVFFGAFLLAFMAKWVRRSNVMTIAEWMKTRFGDGPGGRAARLTCALMAILITTSSIGYAYQGIGKFAAIYIPLAGWAEGLSTPWLRELLVQHDSDVLATLIIGLTTLYVVLGGLYSVVVTDVIQTVVLTVGSLFITWLAWDRLDVAALSTLPDGFTSLAVPWEIPEFEGTEHATYQFFGALVIVWVLKGLLLNIGGPGQSYDAQRFLAARDTRDAAKVGATWSVFLIVRWAMCMGIALLALTGVAGVDDPEEVMPLVLRDFLPTGIRGLVIAGLLAAFMSTFSSTVNSGASYVVRDIWQVLVPGVEDRKRALRVSYLSTIGLVGVGLLIGYHGESIHQIWSWMMMALTAGVVVPNVLRWYWWRTNGWGYASGTLGGVLLALIVFFVPEAPDYVVFPAIVGASLVTAIVVSLATAPTGRETLIEFYRSIRPFGAWGPVRRESGLSEAELAVSSERAGRAVLNTLLGMVAITGAYLFPMYLVGHWYVPASICLGALAAAVVVLYFTWYRYLPPPGEK